MIIHPGQKAIVGEASLVNAIPEPGAPLDAVSGVGVDPENGAWKRALPAEAERARPVTGLREMES